MGLRWRWPARHRSAGLPRLGMVGRGGIQPAACGRREPEAENPPDVEFHRSPPSHRPEDPALSGSEVEYHHTHPANHAAPDTPATRGENQPHIKDTPVGPSLHQKLPNRHVAFVRRTLRLPTIAIEVEFHRDRPSRAGGAQRSYSAPAIANVRPSPAPPMASERKPNTLKPQPAAT